jgi:putative MATE family efflux protein
LGHTVLSEKPASQKPENLQKVMWALAWPAVLLNSLQTVNSLLDNWFVQQLPPSALTAVGASVNVVFLLVSLSFALGTASTAFVSRAFGAGQAEEYRSAATKCLVVSGLAGILAAACGILGAGTAASLFIPTDNQAAIRDLTLYLQLFSLGLPFIFVIQALAGALRGLGDTRSPMVISGIQILLHIVLNYLLIFDNHEILGVRFGGAGLGLAGAGWSFSISAAVAALLYMAWASYTPLKSQWRLSLPSADWVRRILNVAIPAAMMSIVRVTSLMAFSLVLKNVPNASDAIAGMRPGFSIESLAFMPAFGLSIAASALVGQSLGMGDPLRAKKVGWIAAHWAAIVSAAVSLPLFIFADQAALLLLPDQPAVAAVTASYLRFICATEVLFGYGMVLIGAMQGAGDTRRPFWLAIGTMWGFRVPMAGLLALPLVFGIPGLAMGADGCWLAMSISQAVQGLLAMLIWQQGKWATVKI